MKTRKKLVPRAREPVNYQLLVVSGQRFAILPERRLRELCSTAGLLASSGEPRPAATRGTLGAATLDRAALASRLLTRRERVGLSQAALARLAGVRVETLNRVERGRTTPDFATIRKLILAIKKVERRNRNATKGAVP